MDRAIEIHDISMIPALQAWGAQRELRGKEVMETLRKIMRRWVYKALYNIPHGSRDKIKSYLTEQVTIYSSLDAAAARGATPTTKTAKRKVERANQWRGTLAARIVAGLNIYQARHLKFDAFYGKVSKWANKQIFSANIHRAGMLPARQTLKISDPGNPKPRIKNAPGSYEELLGDQMVGILVENWGSSFGGDGIGKLAGDAFEKGLISTVQEFEVWMQEKLERAARRVGLTVTT